MANRTLTRTASFAALVAITGATLVTLADAADPEADAERSMPACR